MGLDVGPDHLGRSTNSFHRMAKRPFTSLPNRSQRSCLNSVSLSLQLLVRDMVSRIVVRTLSQFSRLTLRSTRTQPLRSGFPHMRSDSSSPTTIRLTAAPVSFDR